MATLQSASEQRFILYSVPWQTYSRLLRAFADRPAVRLTYDRGILELMTVSHEHESFAHILGRLVEVLTEVLGLPVKGGGSTTFRRRKRQRGLEPDACWWIANEPFVRGKREIDLRRDPPPDLALEIDVTHSSLSRPDIYAALGVPEVWRLQAETLTCYILQTDGSYQAADTSGAFAGLKITELLPFLALQGQLEENALVRQFRMWVQQRFSR
jgi:Uma2 family endonuclease